MTLWWIGDVLLIVVVLPVVVYLLKGVLDVNRDFQPWLVERRRLFAAMDTFDGEKKRGLLLIE